MGFGDNGIKFTFHNTSDDYFLWQMVTDNRLYVQMITKLIVIALKLWLK